MPAQVKEAVSKPHVLLQEPMTPRRGNCPATNCLAKRSILFTWWGTCFGLLERVGFKAVHPQFFLVLYVAVSSSLSFCEEVQKEEIQFRDFDL